MKTLYFLNRDRTLNEVSNVPIKPRQSDWYKEVNPSRLVRSFEFENIEQLTFFVTSLLNYTRKIDHNPTITIVGGSKVQVETYTPQVNDVTEQDVRLTKMSNQIYKDATYVPPEVEEEEDDTNDERLSEGYRFDWTTDW